VIALGVSIGSGEFLLGPAAFVQHGLSLMWVVIVAAFAEDGSYPADHTRDVPVTHHQHVSMRNGLNVETIDLGNPALASLFAVAK
jgi:hypothetical protein